MKKSLCIAALVLAVSLPAYGLAEGYTAGTYTAEAQGMQSAVKVEMTFSEDAITAVTIDTAGETAGLGTEVAAPLQEAILAAQSAEVDGISGATVSSDAVKAAANDCIAQAGGTVAEATEEVKDFSGESYAGEYAVNDVYAAAEAKSKANAPKVTTLANGVQVQRTPDDVGGYWLRPGSYNSYNTFYLNADNRGCAACHADLAQLMEDSDFEHLDMRNSYDFDLTVSDCMICHDEGAGYLYTNYDFGTLIHGIHSRDSFTGNCWSCHNATKDGNGITLWDESKYDVLQGISAVADVQGDFTYDQTTLTETSSIFPMSWWSGDTTSAMGGATLEGLPLDEDLFNNWEISVTGEVEKPFTMKLVDMIAQAPVEKKIITVDCVMNSNGGPFISTTEVTGIPMSWILEQAGVKDTATAVMSVSTDGWNRGFLLSEMEKNMTYLGYEQNGERLAWAQGYPVSTFNVHDSAASCIRNVVELRVVDTPEDEVKRFKGWDYQDGSGNSVNKPSAGIYHLHEGQIIPANEPWTFEGYADGYDENIVAIEISLDQGQTWTSFSTEDTTRDAWVYWHFTYTPAPGSYVLSVRAVTETGMVTYKPDTVMFNAK